jgi:hypothetical protein
MRAIVIGLAASTALASCSPAPAPQATSAALGARSAHAFTVMSPDGAPTDHLLTGVTGPDADLHPDAADAARAALDQLMAGQQLSLSEAGDADRYGRTPVQARLPDGRDLAAALIETGWAIVWPREGQTADFQALLDAEARARAERAGAWADGVFAVFSPSPDLLAQRLDGPVIVEGRIVSTGEGRDGRLYLNFGLDWRSDFTLSASRRVRADFEEAGRTLDTLDGAVVRARGWLYAENGPMIALTHPAQLEVLDAPQPRSLP